ncbi:hypothetical protein [Chitinophaga sp. sic0106]|uniref:hypothetical protein n=1 Tax=Chitinophaga sp. sic0106 TaxID=2854785 RepID=UPI001C44016A|nr:hypothetical protein [Chitinophaga sp. sic0106]MBV7530801.1 hypothetical protein [Chitinophaga sp. sic0106]
MNKLLCLIAVFVFIAPFVVRAQDFGWPRQVSKNGATLVYYQPQIDSWDDYRTLKGRMAFSLTPSTGRQQVGIATFTAGTQVNNDTRTAYFNALNLTDIRFPSLDEKEVPAMTTLFKELMPTNPQPIAVDRLLADLNGKKNDVKGAAVKNDPPQIFYSTRPAILLLMQGEPVLSPIAKTDLQFVVNTNWDLFYEKSKKEYYLMADKGWYLSKDVKGPYTLTRTLPKDMSKLPAGENFDEVKKMVPPPATTQPEQVFFSDGPAEMILFNGTPVYTRIPGTELLYGANTDNDFFVDNSTKQYYVLLSGRWFSASNTSGPWTYAGDKLPADFKKIPSNSPKSRVLASVPGTTEASDAVMLAQIPTTVSVNKQEAAAKVSVHYDGDPQFKPIETTKLEYAVNTQDKVIKDGDLYYLCFQGIWFMSTRPTGPWETANAVPQEIYNIPPSSPVYNVTYVTQVETSSTTVESSYTAGYFGMFILGAAVGATIAYGTGWWYPPYFYWGAGMMYPWYHPWPMTYGGGAIYNPWTGGFAVGRSVYGPYAAAGSAAWYNPATGRYGRAASVQGWYGGRTVAHSYNPWTGAYGATAQGHNAYSQWGTSVAAKNGHAIQTGHVTTANGTVAGYRTRGGQSGTVVRGDNGTVVRNHNGNVYAGHDGNVYRKNSNGNWSQFSNGSWQNVNTPHDKNLSGATRNNNISGATHNLSGETLHGLDQSHFNRQRGNMQTQRFQNWQRSGGGFNRGGGGFQRGGGRFRR